MRFLCTALLPLLMACEFYPEPPEDNRPERFSEADERSHLPLLRRMEVTFHHVSTEQYNISCSANDDQFIWTIYSLHTESPRLELVEPPIRCEPLEAETGRLSLQCNRFIDWGFPFYWQRFYFDLAYNREGEYSGTIHWLVDGGEYFWCDWFFQVDEVNLIYL